MSTRCIFSSRELKECAITKVSCGGTNSKKAKCPFWVIAGALTKLADKSFNNEIKSCEML